MPSRILHCLGPSFSEDVLHNAERALNDPSTECLWSPWVMAFLSFQFFHSSMMKKPLSCFGSFSSHCRNHSGPFLCSNSSSGTDHSFLAACIKFFECWQSTTAWKASSDPSPQISHISIMFICLFFLLTFVGRASFARRQAKTLIFGGASLFHILLH